jgi:hypothetical protein
MTKISIALLIINWILFQYLHRRQRGKIFIGIVPTLNIGIESIVRPWVSLLYLTAFFFCFSRDLASRILSKILAVPDVRWIDAASVSMLTFVLINCVYLLIRPAVATVKSDNVK